MTKAEKDLCETCKCGDVCELSTKTYRFCSTSECYKYEEADDEKDTNTI